MPALQISPVVRAILTENLDLTADEVIAEAKKRGLKASDASTRGLVYNIKSDLKKLRAGGASAPAKPAPAKKPAPAAKKAAPPARPVAAPAAAREATPPKAAAASDLAPVLANVALVNKVVGAVGGADQARQAAEAVRACGGVENFLQYLDLVAGIRTA